MASQPRLARHAPRFPDCALPVPRAHALPHPTPGGTLQRGGPTPAQLMAIAAEREVREQQDREFAESLAADAQHQAEAAAAKAAKEAEEEAARAAADAAYAVEQAERLRLTDLRKALLEKQEVSVCWCCWSMAVCR